jgi:hypothetical protein
MSKNETSAGDTRDTMLAFASAAGDGFSRAQKLFLAAYTENPQVAPAARLAAVHRATVYRWRQQPAFVQAMERAIDAFYIAHRQKVEAEIEAGKREREQRERERHPQRCATLAANRFTTP